MKNKELLKEYIYSILKENDIESIKQEIVKYKENTKTIEELQKSIEETLKQIKTKSSEETQRLKVIINFMKQFNISKIEGDNWVAELEEVPMYKYPSASYKELWETALGKLNEATQKVLKQIEAAHLLGKKQATKPELKISENIISQGINWLISKWKGLFQSMKEYKQTVEDLPKINPSREEVIRHGAALWDHPLPKELKYKDALKEYSKVDFDFQIGRYNFYKVEDFSNNEITAYKSRLTWSDNDHWEIPDDFYLAFQKFYKENKDKITKKEKGDKGDYWIYLKND